MSESRGSPAGQPGPVPAPPASGGPPSSDSSARSASATVRGGIGALGGPSAGAASAGTPPWAETLSNLVVGTVDKVKLRATVKVVTVLRVLVYGVVILTALFSALVLGLVGLLRMWDVYAPFNPVGRRVWVGYVVLGGLLLMAGGWLLASSRKPKPE